MHILIMEDDQKLARQLKMGVDECGHEANLAFEGREGLEPAQNSEFDVILLDVMLPGVDGVSVMKQLRHRRIGTLILRLTAGDTPDNIAAGLDAGADDYLTKPFSFTVLLARLRALSRRRDTDPHTLVRIADRSLDPETHEVPRAGTGGGISVRSELGKGPVFEVSLPIENG